MADIIQLRRDTAANWVTANPVLADGEIGIETDTKKRKCGNGTTAWNSLPYMFSDDLDTQPTANSRKPVESGGVKMDIDAAVEIGLAALDAIGDADLTPTEESVELVRSGGVWEAIRNNGRGAFDISAYNAVGGVLAKYDDLTAALGTNGANVPADARKPGMSVCFVQNADNKYVQYRLMSDSFNTTVSNWQGVDNEPVAGSENLVKSGGVKKAVDELASEVKVLTGNNFEKIISLNNLESQDYYSMTDGSFQGSEGAYRSGLFDVGDADVVYINFQGSNSSFGVIFLDSDNNFLSSVEANAKSGFYKIPQSASKLIVQFYNGWKNTIVALINTNANNGIVFELKKENDKNVDDLRNDIYSSINSIEFDYKHRYITPDGFVTDTVTTSNTVGTDYIKVKEGDVLSYTGYVYGVMAIGGFIDKGGSGVELLPKGTYNKERIVIPNGINYIVAVSYETHAHSIYKVDSVNERIHNINEYIEEIKPVINELHDNDTVNKANTAANSIGYKKEIKPSMLTSWDYYSMSDGSYEGNSGAYRSGVFNVDEFDIVRASFQDKNASFGLLFYDNNDTFIKSISSYTNPINVNVKDIGASKVIVQNYNSWNDTFVVFEKRGNLKERIIVDINGNGDYASLSEAVRNAVDGDIIFVRKGTYEDEVVRAWDKDITIIGEDVERTIIRNGSNNYSTPPIEMSCGSLENITFEAYDGGLESEHPSGWNCYALHIENNYLYKKSFIIRNCKFFSAKNRSVGIGLRGGTLRFENCRFESDETPAFSFHDSANKEYADIPQNISLVNCVGISRKNQYVLVFHSLKIEGAKVNVEFIGNTFVSLVSDNPLISHYNNSGYGEADTVYNFLELVNFENLKTSRLNNLEGLNYKPISK